MPKDSHSKVCLREQTEGSFPLTEIPETSVAQSAPHAWSLASLLAPLVAFAGLAVWGLSGGSKKQSLADLEHGQWAMAASQAGVSLCG